jgi:hypothetical protein
MPTPAQNRAVQLNAARRRTPRILKVAFAGADPGAGMVVTFDRPMDSVPSTPVAPFEFRLFTAGQGYTFTAGTWTDERTFTLTAGSSLGAVAGEFVVYMNGDLRAKARFFVDNGERCERMEIA